MPVAPLDKCTVTGTIESPDGKALHPATVRFTLSGRARDGLVTIVPAPVDAPTDVDGNISVDLWPNANDSSDTFYTAVVQLNGVRQEQFPPFRIVVPIARSANLEEIMCGNAPR